MDFYALGQSDATGMFKVADYADWIAKKIAKKPSVRIDHRIEAASLGGGLGSALGSIIGSVSTGKKIDAAAQKAAPNHPPGHVAAATRHPQYKQIAEKLMGQSAAKGGNIGGAIGAVGVPALQELLSQGQAAQRRRVLAGHIRNVAPKAALGLGAGTLAIGLANHFLSKPSKNKNDQNKR